jgi:hypothetical protein
MYCSTGIVLYDNHYIHRSVYIGDERLYNTIADVHMHLPTILNAMTSSTFFSPVFVDCNRLSIS